MHPSLAHLAFFFGELVSSFCSCARLALRGVLNGVFCTELLGVVAALLPPTLMAVPYPLRVGSSTALPLSGLSPIHI